MASTPAAACDDSFNDISGLAVAGIAIDTSPTFGRTPQLLGNELALGSGGISTTGSHCAGDPSPATIGMALALGASQTWTIGGCAHVTIAGSSVTGTSADALTINGAGQELGVSTDIETGPITINNAGVSLPDPFAGFEGRLNATNGNTVTVNGGLFASTQGTVGALTVKGGSFLRVGTPCCDPPAGRLTARGAVALDPAGQIEFSLLRAGTRGGTDYSQLNAAGNSVDLKGTGLTLWGGFTRGSATGCPILHLGKVDTLIQAAAITGTFGGVPNGKVVPVECLPAGGQPPSVRINYSQTRVTATVVIDPAKALTVRKTGTGLGTVTSDMNGPEGIDCGALCSAEFAPGRTVALGAEAAAGSAFGGWSGACHGTAPMCEVTMSSAHSVRAKFVALAPGTRITSSRLDRKHHTLRFKFSAIGHATGFECALTRNARKARRPSFSRCRSPKTYRGLRPGSYTFRVRARNRSAVDKSPARKTFKL